MRLCGQVGRRSSTYRGVVWQCVTAPAHVVAAQPRLVTPIDLAAFGHRAPCDDSPRVSGGDMRPLQKSILSKKHDPRENGKVETAASACIALTVSEIRKLLCRLGWRYLPDLRAVIHCSLWRRHHQVVAYFYHRQRRAVPA